MRVVLLLRSLLTGGTESQFAQVADGLAAAGHDVEVVTLLPGGALSDWLRERGRVEVTSLFDGDPHGSLGKGRLALAAPLLRRRLRARPPAAVYSTNAVTHLLGWSARVGLPGVRSVWGVRSMVFWDRRAMVAAGAAAGVVSRRVPAAVYNSRASIPSWRRLGFRPRREVFLPNGVDVARFRPDPEARRALRAGWGVADGEVLLGMVARFDTAKDHPTALRGLARVLPRHPEVRVALVGPDRDVRADDVRALARELGVEERVLWLGSRRDAPAVYAALDAHLLTSRSEGFPNAPLEALACGTPSLVTAVGEAPFVVGELGVVVPPRDPEALAEGVERLLARLREPGLREACRERAARELSLERLIARTAALLADPEGCPLDADRIPVVRP